MEFEGKKAVVTPEAVFIIGTYDENGVPNAMNAAWGTQKDPDEVIIVLSKHKTTENFEKTGAFTLAFGTADTVTISDFFGVTTGNKIITGSRTRMIAYCGIFFVIFIWGLYPILTSDLLTFYSGGMFTFISSLVSAAALLLICVPKLKLLDRFYFKVAVPTGFFVGLANLLQKMGLQYTTPTQYAFLENLSCVVVPVLLFLFIRKKPGLLTVMASVLCLAGCFVLSGLYLSGGGASFGRGEILCALAGVMSSVET